MCRISHNIVFREIDNQIVMINLESGFYYSLNEAGRFIFSLLLNDVDFPEIMQNIVHDFGITRSRAKKDLREFLDSLAKEQVIIGSY